MKKMSKMLSMLLALVLMCSSAAVGVFAAEDTAAPEKDAVAESVDEAAAAEDLDVAGDAVVEEAMAAEDAQAAETDGDAAATELTAPANFRALPDRKSVLLSWDAVPGATKYIIYRKISGKEKKLAETEACKYLDKAAKKDKTYAYRVVAANDTQQGPATAFKKAARVRTAYYVCTFKASVKLKSHDKKRKAVVFKRGQKVTAEGYGTGAYKFTYNGRPYEAKWFRMGKVSVKYKADAYTDEIAENYVNRGKYSSKTGYLVWVSIYAQRVFLFKGSKGHWKCIRSESCNTGAGKSPTPTGFSKKIHKKYARHSKHRFWNCFSSANAIHGRNGGDAKPGKPVSNGCVRVSNEFAKWIMNNVKIGTKVISW